MPDRLRLSFACGLYDRMDALRTGAVQPDGIDLQYIAVASPRDIFDRMGRDRAFDLSEFGRSLADLLADGKLNAVMGTRRSARPDHVVPLFADARSVEREFYRNTRIFPIMHLVVIRRHVYERAPWIAASLYDAFVKAKDQALANLRRAGPLPYMLPWLHHDMAEIDADFGGDPWPYGIEVNRPTLQALVQYMAEQHLIAKAMPIEQLFVPHGAKS